MFYLIETFEQLGDFKNKGIKEAFVEVISYNDCAHPILNDVSLVYIKPFNNEKGYLICIHHSESLSVNISHVNALLRGLDKIYVRNKKQFLYYFPFKHTIDLSLLTQIDNISTTTHDFFYQKHSNLLDINLIIPITKHYEKCEIIFDKIKHVINKPLPTWFEFYNNKATLAFLGIEKNGIKINSNIFDNHFKPDYKEYSVKNNIIYTQYNLYTTTRRPSNSYNNINFSALNKDTECRKTFLSQNGKLIEIDISAYHPTLIASLVGYKFNNDVYNELAELYGTDYKTAKEITFKQLYGGIFPEYKEIEYFRKTQDYINKLWNDFQNNGFIETPISKFRFTIENIENPTPNKLFNYVLQELETSSNVEIIWDILKILKGKKTKLVLYVYDSFVLDWDEDGNDTLEQIKNIFAKRNLQFKIKQGFTYNF
jgi:hypothetical protein